MRWEYQPDGSYRIEVPGGWIYHVERFDGNNTISGFVFVPDTGEEPTQ